MEKIEPGKYVELVYDLYAVEPTGDVLVHQVDLEDPERIIFGVTRGVIKPLEQAVEGLKAGDTFDVKVSAEDGFGMHDPEQVAHLEKEMFEIDGKFDADRIKAGEYVPMLTQDGYRINGKVIDVTANEVIMDFNHPLAGKDIRFVGTIKTVREATQEELHPASCGCGGCHGGDGGEGCGDSCGCGDGCGGCN